MSYSSPSSNSLMIRSLRQPRHRHRHRHPAAARASTLRRSHRLAIYLEALGRKEGSTCRTVEALGW